MQILHSDGWESRNGAGLQILHSGIEYFISLYINYSYYHPLNAVASNKIGLKFSTVAFDEFNLPSLNNSAHLFTDSVITDTSSWIQLSGQFVADSTYKFIIIGNLFDDAHTDTIALSPVPDAAYYYIDDVCVSTDSTYCFDAKKSSKLIMPNVFTPDGDSYNDLFLPMEPISFSDARLEIFNRWGIKVFQTNNLNLGWDGGSEPAGVYFWIIKYLADGSITQERGYLSLIK